MIEDCARQEAALKDKQEAQALRERMLRLALQEHGNKVGNDELFKIAEEFRAYVRGEEQ